MAGEDQAEHSTSYAANSSLIASHYQSFANSAVLFICSSAAAGTTAAGHPPASCSQKGACPFSGLPPSRPINSLVIHPARLSLLSVRVPFTCRAAGRGSGGPSHPREHSALSQPPCVSPRPATHNAQTKKPSLSVSPARPVLQEFPAHPWGKGTQSGYKHN